MNMEDKEFMGKYILNNPFDFKQEIISHCREMDKIDVYNWVAEDEIKIDKLQQENQQLKNDINKLQKELNDENLQCSKYSIEFNNLKEKNEQLKDNWNELKKFALEKQVILFGIEYTCYSNILDKMQELEGNDSNE